MKQRVTATLIAAGLLVAGCASDDQDKKEDKPKDPKPAVLKAARAYQNAANRLDWQSACTLSSARLRDGTVNECAERNIGPDATTSPSPSASASSSGSPSPSDSPPTYADGSTPDPLPSRTSAEPERADTGPVSAGGVIKVPAVAGHPAGYGVLVTYTVQWPGKDAITKRRALRLVSAGGTWRVDQHEDVQDGDMGRGSPVRAALSGG